MQVGLGVLVGVGVGVAVDVGVGVIVGVTVGVGVAVAVGVGVGVSIGVGVSVGVGVGDSVGVGVGVGDSVGVGVGVTVGEVVGVGVGVGEGPAHDKAVTMSLIKVTAPFRAQSRPLITAPLLTVILSRATTVPLNTVVVSRVAELPTCQKMLQLSPVPVTTAPGPVISVLPIWKTHTSSGPPFKVSTPVKLTDDE